jgi:sucrose porin
VQALSQQTTAREQKQQATISLSEQLAKRPDDGFTFNAYARSGMLVNSHGGAPAGRASPGQFAQRRCPRRPSRQRKR